MLGRSKPPPPPLYPASLRDITVKLSLVPITIEDNFNALNDEINRQTENVNSLKVCQEEIGCAMKKVNNLEGHVTNIENLLFSDISKGSNKIVLKWKLQNYQHYFDLGERVYSPIFYTQIKDYCFKMLIGWIGNNKENLWLGLKLCRRSNYEKELEPFNMIFSLGMVDNKGVTKLNDVPLSTISMFRENCFTLSPGENESKMGFGGDFLDKCLINNYISNVNNEVHIDTFTVRRCKIKI